jgi:hypothetical protein
MSAVGVGEAALGEVVLAADDVVEVVAGGRVHLVVADHEAGRRSTRR